MSKKQENEVYWLRLGDQDGYAWFYDLESVAETMKGSNIQGPFHIVVPGCGFACSGHEAHNYVSLFVGDNTEQPDIARFLTDKEWKWLFAEMEKPAA